MPCGLASAEPSGRFGTPVESEKRTVAGMVLPSNSFALLSAGAPGEALKLPSTTTPFAWLARYPGWVPKALFIASTIWTGSGSSSAQATAGDAKATTASVAASLFLSMFLSVPFAHVCALIKLVRYRKAHVGPFPGFQDMS